jgi:Uncharacterised nucleotidyltransferase
VSFAPEDRLLLATLRAALGEDQTTEVQALLAQELDWQYLLDASIRHAVSPLVFEGLGRAAPGPEPRELPERVWRELGGLHAGSGARNQRLLTAIDELAASFANAGIRALALKELQLAFEAYPDPALRPIGDVDILIRPEDYAQASGELALLGFEPLPGPDIPFTRKYACAHHFRRVSDDVWVDLQWNVAEREWDLYGDGTFTFDPETLWEGALTLSLGESSLAAPRPEPMLLHLCMHAEGHSYGELVLFADILVLLARYGADLDWDRLGEITRRYGAESTVYYVLLLTERLLGAQVSPSFLEAIAPRLADAGLSQALFGNLGQLHLSLDDLRSAARPPALVMDRAEYVVRAQTVAAMEIDRAVRDVLATFETGGGSVAVLEGAKSERILPDARLAPLGELSLVILAEDLPLFSDALARHGFEERACEPRHFMQSREAASRDPVLVDRAPSIRIAWRLESHNGVAEDPGEGMRRAKKDLALRLLRARHDDDPLGRTVAATINVAALSREAAFLRLASRLGRRREDRLFTLWELLDFCRSGPDALRALDWSELGRQAEAAGAGAAACDALAMLDEVLEEGAVPDAPAASLAWSGRRPRVFEWARYGPDALEQHSYLKRPFFVAYVLRAVPDWHGRASYLARVLIGGDGTRPLTHSLAVDLVRGVRALVRRERPTARELAVWIDPPTAGRRP